MSVSMFLCDDGSLTEKLLSEREKEREEGEEEDLMIIVLREMSLYSFLYSKHMTTLLVVPIFILTSFYLFIYFLYFFNYLISLSKLFFFFFLFL